jgi:hypothetical protein
MSEGAAPRLPLVRLYRRGRRGGAEDAEGGSLVGDGGGGGRSDVWQLSPCHSERSPGSDAGDDVRGLPRAESKNLRRVGRMIVARAVLNASAGMGGAWYRAGPRQVVLRGQVCASGV